MLQYEKKRALEKRQTHLKDAEKSIENLKAQGVVMDPSEKNVHNSVWGDYSIRHGSFTVRGTIHACGKNKRHPFRVNYFIGDERRQIVLHQGEILYDFMVRPPPGSLKSESGRAGAGSGSGGKQGDSPSKSSTVTLDSKLPGRRNF